MTLNHFSVQRLQESLGSILEAFETSHRKRLFFSWSVFIIGLIIYISAQSYLVLGPLWTRALPPEVDDSLAYLVRTQEMEECPSQDCLAIKDLRKQIYEGSDDSGVKWQRHLATFPFPLYHPLFSAILLFAKKWTLDLVTAYKIVWSLAPLFFGIGFACLLSAIWGRTAAGLALGLLAFRVFPGSGLHYVTPANLAMGICVLVWARIIFRRGDAPWTLVFGSIAALAMHPLGGLYSLISAFLTLTVSETNRKKRIWVAFFSLFLVMSLALLVPLLLEKPYVFKPFDYLRHFPEIAQLIQNFLSATGGALIQTVRLKAGLFGSFSLFCLMLCIGFFAAPKARRKIAVGIIFIYTIFLFLTLFHSDPTWTPGELFWRTCIPLVVICFGAVGKCACFASEKSLALFKGYLRDPDRTSEFSIQNAWPILILALVSGYSFEMVLSGSEQIYATQKYMQNRMAYNFDSAQTDLLLSEAETGDRVLYTSTMIMASYFIHGAMQLGAVYYHPVLKRTNIASEWLQREDLRFAVAYNPTVYHPSLEGLDEKNRNITGPEFHFSPLNKPRKYGPISREGFISAADFKWIQVNVKESDFPKHLRILIRNPGESSRVRLVPVKDNGVPLWQFKTKTIPAQWTGWVELDIDEAIRVRRFRIILPRGQPQFSIGGIVFGNDKNLWPWAQKAVLTLHAKEPDTGKILLIFDPALILPPPLNKRKITVLNDHGSSVLFRVDRSCPSGKNEVQGERIGGLY